MDPEATEVVAPHLLARETLLWSGRPQDTTSLRLRAAVIVLVGIAALALRALPLDSSLADRADSNSVVLAVIVVVLIAEAIVFHTYLSNTFYGITNQRVIIVSGLSEREMAAVLIDRLNRSQLRIRRGRRDIELSAPSDQMLQQRNLPFTNPSVPPDWLGPESYRLIGLQNPQQVYDLILEAAHELK
jgi:hypothetical protein